MKKGILLPLILYAAATAYAETYKLNEAVQKKLVSVKLNGATPDTAYQYTGDYIAPCMAMEIVSNYSTDLTLSLDYGYKLEPADSTYQTMMVTQTLIVKLPAKQKKNYRIYAMCTQAPDKGPSQSQAFKVGRRSDGNLLGLAELINRRQYQNGAAQDAVWCLTDNHDIQSISSNDTTVMYELRRFVVKAKGLPLSNVYNPVYTEPAYVEPLRTYRTRTTYSGELSYSVSRPAKVLVALFDSENHMKRVYVNNETQREGQYSYGYQISSSEMEGKKYYLRMFRDGKMEQEVVINPE